MAQSAFHYVTYIRAAPERVWSALTDRAVIPRYWFGMTCDSDWRPGRPWKLTFADGRIADEGEILESEPPKKLVIKWFNTFRPELAAEGPARCAMLLEPQGVATKLTVRHEMDAPRSLVIEAVSDGWPKILSNLKSLLETGEVAITLGAAEAAR
ncbi:MAG: SRPBCC family protein [Pseudomonadota bacterium]|nr:SRPBCC family protein [Pseudomonadota bacterium]